MIEVGDRLAVTPDGAPLTVSATAPVNPFCAATVAVKLVDLPEVIVCEDGVADSVKSGVNVTAFTTTVAEVLCVRVPLVPVMVSL